jgi:hypothetical protein
MKLTHPHQHSIPEVQRRINAFIPQFLSRYSGRVTDPQHHWEGNNLHFSGKVLSFRISGTLVVNPDNVSVDVGVPFMARPFEPEIKTRIIAHLEELLA